MTGAAFVAHVPSAIKFGINCLGAAIIWSFAVIFMSDNTETLNRPYPWEASYPGDQSWDVSFKNGTLNDLLSESVAAYGDKVALEFLDPVRGFKSAVSYSYRQMGALVDQVASGLQAHGVTKGTHVGLFLPNCPYYPIFFFAIAKAGGVVVNFNPLYPVATATQLVEAAQVEIMVTLDTAAIYTTVAEVQATTSLKKVIVCPFADVVPSLSAFLLKTLGRKTLVRPIETTNTVGYKTLLGSGKGRWKFVEVRPEDVAALQFTGGTTGMPKAATLTHANLYINCQQVMGWWGLSEAGRDAAAMLAVLPFYHVFAMTCCLSFMLMLGGKVIMVTHSDRSKLIGAIPRLLQKRQATFFAGVPTLYSAINAHPDVTAGKIDFSKLKFAISGGAPLPAAIASEFRLKTKGYTTLIEGYGLSETSPIAVLHPAERPIVMHDSGVGSIGIPVPGTIVEIVDPETGCVVAPGERGEVCITGPQVMQGYWQRPDANAEVLDAGRFHTGDVGIMDKNGFFFIVDRLKDMIIVSGLNVYPREVEELINAHPDVLECAVYGVPDAHAGEQVNAAVVIKPESRLEAGDLRAAVRASLTGYQTPKVIEFVEELPKSPVGKILKKDLRAAWAEKQILT